MRSSRDWALEADELRYVPKGAGSYHWRADVLGSPKYFITVDDLETKPWIGQGRDVTFEGLGLAYEAAWQLHHDAGLALVVAPLRRPNRSVTLRLSGHYSMAVFPFVNGDSGTWGDSLTDAGRDALLQELATLHQATPRVRVPMARRPLGLPERPLLTATLGALDRPWVGGPFSEPARRALARHVEDVAHWLELLDVMASRLDEADAEAVLTHGEPHPGNLMRTVQGLRLIDWDTVALAQPERDLWMLDDGSDGGLGLYEDLTEERSAPRPFPSIAWSGPSRTLRPSLQCSGRRMKRRRGCARNGATFSVFSRAHLGSLWGARPRSELDRGAADASRGGKVRRQPLPRRATSWSWPVARSSAWWSAVWSSAWWSALAAVS